MRFKRVAEAFDEAVRQQRPPCESSGSEYWPDDQVGSGDLSDLVNSFIHGDDHDHHHDPHTNTINIDYHYNIVNDGDGHDYEHDDDREVKQEKDHDEEEEGDDDEWVDEGKAKLMSLLAGQDEGGGGGERAAVERVRDEIEVGCRVIGKMMVDDSTNGFKRLLVAHLRDQGYDAGLCMARWEGRGRCPPGDHEYVDINIAGARHIVELNLAKEFHIARPMARYTALLGILPPSVFIGKPETLKQVVRLMTIAMKESLKKADLHVAPWRRSGYMLAKWFGPCKRTINRVPSGERTGPGDGGVADISFRAKKRSVGFEALSAVSTAVAGSRGGFCRDHDHHFIGCKVGLRVGLLAATFHKETQNNIM